MSRVPHFWPVLPEVGTFQSRGCLERFPAYTKLATCLRHRVAATHPALSAVAQSAPGDNCCVPPSAAARLQAFPQLSDRPHARSRSADPVPPATIRPDRHTLRATPGTAPCAGSTPSPPQSPPSKGSSQYCVPDTSAFLPECGAVRTPSSNSVKHELADRVRKPIHPLHRYFRRKALHTRGRIRVRAFTSKQFRQRGLGHKRTLEPLFSKAHVTHRVENERHQFETIMI